MTHLSAADLRYVREGSGPTVVLLHPLRMQLEYWTPLRQALGTGCDVVALDLPGHGQSSAPRAEYDAAHFTDGVEQFLEACDLRNVILVGESIGAAIALGLAARHDRRVGRVLAINPYDYGVGGGVRRSSVLAGVLFTMFSWPVIGELTLRVGTKGILRRILEGGLFDRTKLPSDLVDDLWACGALPGHAEAFLSLARNWWSWIAARATYATIQRPVTLAYSDHDWSRAHERSTNSSALALATSARTLTITSCGHFAALDRPEQVAALIRIEVAAHTARPS
jgi:pimeloyl-ACP methyl ester carboxylesterase